MRSGNCGPADRYTLLNEEGDYGIIPYFRGIPTDLNFTVALALIAVVAIQVVGFKAQGPGYIC